ncbi:MAG: hypothetical protein ABW200_06890 [Hyphomicrobiaceae bacterium]
MTAMLIFAVVASVAAVFGAIAGRVLAVEAQGRLAAIFAGTYVAAGAGLLTALLLGPVLALAAQLLNTSSTWFDALDVAGTSLLWGTAGGAAGGLAISLTVAVLKTWQGVGSIARKSGQG